MTFTSEGLELLKGEGRGSLEVVTGSKEDTAPSLSPQDTVYERQQPLLETAMQEIMSSGDSYITKLKDEEGNTWRRGCKSCTMRSRGHVEELGRWG